jgi:hypothetical protein
MAQRFWPGQDPLGRQFRCAGEDRTVVGVTRTGKYNRLTEASRCFFYLPYLQGVPDLDLGICIKTRGHPASFVDLLRQTVHGLDPAVELWGTMPMTQHVGLVLFPQRIASGLLSGLGGAALLLAAMGVYAVMAYAVSQRTQEFGIRLALGARPRDVMFGVLRQGLILTGCGIGAGLALAMAGSRLLSSFLFGVNPMDWATFLVAPLVLAGVALLAIWVPARRATQVDPIVALRCE